LDISPLPPRGSWILSPLAAPPGSWILSPLAPSPGSWILRHSSPLLETSPLAPLVDLGHFTTDFGSNEAKVGPQCEDKRSLCETLDVSPPDPVATKPRSPRGPGMRGGRLRGRPGPDARPGLAAAQVDGLGLRRRSWTAWGCGRAGGRPGFAAAQVDGLVLRRLAAVMAGPAPATAGVAATRGCGLEAPTLRRLGFANGVAPRTTCGWAGSSGGPVRREVGLLFLELCNRLMPEAGSGPATSLPMPPHAHPGSGRAGQQKSGARRRICRSVGS